MRYVITAAVQGQRAGTILDSAQESPGLIASLLALGVLVPLPNAPVETAAVNARGAYAAGSGDEVANSLMTAGLARGAGLAAKGRDLVWSNVDGDAATWLDVMSIVELSRLGPTVTAWFEPTTEQGFIEPPGVYDFRRGTLAAAYLGAGGNNINVVGSELRNVGALHGAILHFLADSTLTWDPPPPLEAIVILLQYGGTLQNDTAGPAPVRVTSAHPLILGGILGGSLVANPGPVVSLGPSALLYAISINSTLPGSIIGDGTVVSDDGTAAILFGHDGNFAGFPSLPGFSGTMANIPLNGNGGSGPTSARPVSLDGPLPTGWIFYDTDIDKPIVVNAAHAWVDYAGNPV